MPPPPLLHPLLCRRRRRPPLPSHCRRRFSLPFFAIASGDSPSPPSPASILVARRRPPAANLIVSGAEEAVDGACSTNLPWRRPAATSTVSRSDHRLEDSSCRWPEVPW
uniref:Uncharacterized protein n=1 Tax=Leersia perrieri TaxID=77586 RepID=A0A0D9X0S3_9ORYZ